MLLECLQINGNILKLFFNFKINNNFYKPFMIFLIKIFKICTSG